MNMSEEKKYEFKVQRWYDNRNRALANKWYAIGRIDLLIISISGGGIYIVFELIKHFQGLGVNLIVLKLAALLFTIAIIVNFISQFYGYSANELEAKYNNIEFKNAIDELKKDDCDQKILDDKIKGKNWWVNFCNYISVAAMLIGVTLLVVFNFIYL